jgi:dihydropteroate synthase
LPDLAVDGLPLLAGISRKSMLGAITGHAVDDRLPASLAAALLAAQRGASILRVHDVAATRDVLAVWHAVAQC